MGEGVMANATKAGIMDLAEGFKVTFHENAERDGNIEIVSIGERKADFALLRAAVDAVDPLDDLGYLSSVPESEGLDVGDSSQVAISVRMSASDGECTIIPVFVFADGEMVAFAPDNWITDHEDAHHTEWGPENCCIYGLPDLPQYSDYWHFTVSAAVAALYPATMTMLVQNDHVSYTTVVSNANHWYLKDANGSIISSVEGTSVSVGPESSEEVTFNITWGAHDLQKVYIARPGVSGENPAKVIDITYGNINIVPKAISYPIGFVASAVQDENGKYFTPVQTVNLFGAQKVYFLVSVLTGTANAIDIESRLL